MKKKIFFCAIFNALVCVFVYSQSLYIRSSEFLKNGKEETQKGNYEKALDFFYQINESDTAYYVMLSEAAIAEYLLENYDKTITHCKTIYEYNPRYNWYIYVIWGEALIQNDQNEKALEVYETALELYPLNADFYNLIAGLAFKQNDFEKALLYSQKTLKLNPYHLKAHYLLGHIASIMGNSTHAIMSFSTYLLINSKGKDARNTLLTLEDVAANEIKGDDLPIIPKSLTINLFEDIDRLIKSKVALAPQYKTPIKKIDGAIIKQMQLLIEKFNLKENTEDFWMDFYGPLFYIVKEKNYYESLMYVVLSSLDLTSVDKWKKKNKKILDAFVKDGNFIFEKYNKYRTYKVNDSLITLQSWLYEGYLFGLGNTIANDLNKKIGYWIILGRNGNVLAEGNYDNTHKKIGQWRYYNADGTLKSKEEINIEEKLHITYEYYPEGTLKNKRVYRNDILNGNYEAYYRCGNVFEITPYVDGKKHGTAKEFSPTGVLLSESNYINDKIEGAYIRYFNNTQIDLKNQFVNNLIEGRYESYNRNGVLILETEVKNNKPIGVFKEYHDNGTLKSEGNWNNNGDINGIYKSYDLDGNLIIEKEFAKGSIIYSKNFDSEDGKLYSLYEYNNKKQLYAITFYDKQGNEKVKYNTKNTNFVEYYPTGEKQAEGKYLNYLKTGKWTYYYLNGNIASVYNYNKDNADGLTRSFFSTGQLKAETHLLNNEYHGIYKSYYKNGQIESEGFYENNQRQGLWKWYYQNGTLKKDAFFMNDDLVKWIRFFACDGKISLKHRFANDVLLEAIFYDTLGQVLTHNHFSEGNESYYTKFQKNKNRSIIPVECFTFHGKAVLYFSNGNISQEFYYFEDDFNGPTYNYYYNGFPERKGAYFGGKRSGIWTFYFEEDKEMISSIGKYDNGRDSLWTWFWPNGNKRILAHYKNGNKHGTYSLFDHSGKLMIEYLFKKDELISYRYQIQEDTFCEPIMVNNIDDTVTGFYPNGQKSVEIPVKFKENHGKQIYYDYNGQLMREAYHSMGEFEGSFIEYYANGNIKREMNYILGNIDGIANDYYENGNLKKTETYMLGELNGWTRYYDTNGNEVNALFYWDGNEY